MNTSQRAKLEEVLEDMDKLQGAVGLPVEASAQLSMRYGDGGVSSFAQGKVSRTEMSALWADSED